MSLFKVRALYDFAGEPQTAEISISAGEIISVTRIDIGEGWWEGTNSKGQSGLFPEAYVERIADNSKPPSTPAPVLPPQNDWGEGGNQEDDWDDEWDNDDTYSEIGNSTQRGANETNQNYVGADNQYSYMGGQAGQVDNVSESNFSVDNKGTVSKKSLNRFSSYVKSGLESYILGEYNI